MSLPTRNDTAETLRPDSRHTHLSRGAPPRLCVRQLCAATQNVPRPAEQNIWPLDCATKKYFSLTAYSTREPGALFLPFDTFSSHAESPSELANSAFTRKSIGMLLRNIANQSSASQCSSRKTQNFEMAKRPDEDRCCTSEATSCLLPTSNQSDKVRLHCSMGNGMASLRLHFCK